MLRTLLNLLKKLVKSTNVDFPEQWTEEERRELERQDKPPLEINLVKSMNDEFTENLLETLASLEHERWASWQKYLHSNCVRLKGRLIMSPKYVEHLEKLINTPYSELPEEKKEMDRKEVRKYLKVIRRFLRRR